MQETNRTADPHQLIMQNRNVIEMTGVSDVDSFDDNTVIVTTSLGELTVRGHGIHVRRLDLEGGTLSLEGKVDALSYSEPSRGGLFGRLLR